MTSSGLAATFEFLILVAGAAPAQEVVEEEKERRAAEEEIVVTGSRIRRKDLTTPAPVAVFTQQQIAESGRLTVGDFLQLMPEQGNGANTQVNNAPGNAITGGFGTTRINLRSLGENRTLVLVNGRRLAASGPGADQYVDVNSIPAVAVERIEVLKDGASAVYGSDSMGGVVNIITRRRFEGTELRAFGAISPHGDGQTYSFSATTGRGGERGNVLFSATFERQEPVWAGDRVFSAASLRLDAATGTVTRGGSGTVPEGHLWIAPAAMGMPLSNPAQDGRIDLYNKLVVTFPDTNSFIRDPSSALGWRPFERTKDTYNFQPYNYDLTPHQALSLFSIGDLTLGSRARAYYEASFVIRESKQQFAPEPLRTDDDAVTVSASNRYNPFGVDVQQMWRRMVETGNRHYFEDANVFRGVVGVDGTMPFGEWFWDASLSFGRSTLPWGIDGQHNSLRLQAAVGPSWLDSAGNPHCGTDAAHDIAGCVPLDLFHGAGSITPAQAAYITYTGVERGIDQTTTIQINTSGELFRLAADRPVALGAGYEYRRLYGSFIPDLILARDFDPVSAGYHVNEGYAELSIPIVSGLPFAEAVEAMAAGRVFRYSTVGGGTTYKVGARWSIVRDVTVRGTYSTAFRAPALQELFSPQRTSEQTVQDPCSGPGIDPNSPLGKACGSAVNNRDFDTAFQYTTGGNRDLKPETANILTAGIVFEPTFVKNLSVTADYYNIVLPNAIDQTGAYVILGGCFPTQAGVAPRLCDLITRDPQTHLITSIRDFAANIGAIKNDGIDLAVRYAIPSRVGRFGLRFDATWLHRFDVTRADGTILHGRGTYDWGVNPALKFVAGATWALSGLNVAVNTRYLGGFRECGDDGIFPGQDCSVDATWHRRVHAYNSWDLYASYGFGNSLGKTTFAAGVNNVFNTPPPLIYSSFWPTSDPQTYDFIGRYLYARVMHRF